MPVLTAIMIGDVVGDPGLEVLESRLPVLIGENAADFVTVNGENAAGGFGLTGPILERILAAGADVVTSGNHVWEKREFWPVMDAEKRVVRPYNYPENPGRAAEPTAGRGWISLEKPSPWGGDPIPWLVLNLQGREYMTPIDCPFRAYDTFESGLGVPATVIDPLLGAEGRLPEAIIEKPIILVDFHAESSREKEALAYYLDGRAGVVAGTHTHVQTTDERLLPGGTAYITDLGMCGAMDGVIGMDTKICLDRARNQVLYRMEVAAPGSSALVQGIIVEFDGETRKAISIKRIANSK